MKRQPIVEKATKKQFVFEMYIEALKAMYKAQKAGNERQTLAEASRACAFNQVLECVFFVSESDIEQAHLIAQSEA